MSTIDSSSTKQPFGWVIGKEETTYKDVKGVSYQIRMSLTKNDPLHLVTVFFKTVGDQDDTVEHLTLLKGMRSLRKDKKKDELLAVKNKVQLKKVSPESELYIKVTPRSSKPFCYKIRIKDHAHSRIQTKADQLGEDVIPEVLKTVEEINKGNKPASPSKSEKHNSTSKQSLAPVTSEPSRMMPFPHEGRLRKLIRMNREYEVTKKELDRLTPKSRIPGLAFAKSAWASVADSEFKRAYAMAGTAAQTIRNKLKMEGNQGLPLNGAEECKVVDTIRRLEWEKGKWQPLPQKAVK
jgi:hypothetical protein